MHTLSSARARVHTHRHTHTSQANSQRILNNSIIKLDSLLTTSMTMWRLKSELTGAYLHEAVNSSYRHRLQVAATRYNSSIFQELARLC